MHLAAAPAAGRGAAAPVGFEPTSFSSTGSCPRPLDHGAVIGKRFGGSVQPLRSFEASVFLDGSEDVLDDLSPVYGDRQDPVRELAGLASHAEGRLLGPWNAPPPGSALDASSMCDAPFVLLWLVFLDWPVERIAPSEMLLLLRCEFDVADPKADRALGGTCHARDLADRVALPAQFARSRSELRLRHGARARRRAS